LEENSMRPRLNTALSFWKQDITALALVAIYVTLAFLIASAWSYLSDEANAYVSDAQRIDRQELADTVRFQLPAAINTKNSTAEIAGVKSNEGAPFEGKWACSTDGAAISQELKTILSQQRRLVSPPPDVAVPRPILTHLQ
jgi:hypothetical protein